MVFAIAYTDVNPADGPGFKPGTDVLIAKLVGANRDETPGAGAKVIMDRYPTDFTATSFANFGVTEHVAVGVTVINDATRQAVVVDLGSRRKLTFAKTIHPDGVSTQHYSEARAGKILFNVSDTIGRLENPDPEDLAYDEILAIKDWSTGKEAPSKPSQLVTMKKVSAADDQHVDVDFFLP